MKTRNRIEYTCLGCDIQFAIYPSEAKRGRGKYCTQACYHRASIRPPLERFMSKVKQSDGCWIWAGARDGYGYGNFLFTSNKKDHIKAHRAAYQFFVGPIPDGNFVCHTCDNPACVRPDHLFLGTPNDNMQDMIKKGRSKHPRGFFGEACASSKLTEVEVLQIRELAATIKAPTIARKFGIGVSTAYRIIKRESWPHI